MISAKIIADSITRQGHRLTSFIVTFPRFILAEFNTHRALSRNSASSRARPYSLTVKEVQNKPFIPIAWMRTHKGMQGSEYFDSTEEKNQLQEVWLKARDEAVKAADTLNRLGLTKQMTNRLLEPFMWHTVIVTGTEWDNFFALRANEATEIHFQQLSHMMLDVYNASTPRKLCAGQWHIPYGDQFDEEKIRDLCVQQTQIVSPDQMKIKIATARCARISYAPFEDITALQSSYVKDLELHDRLASMGHWSPFEHCAKAMTDEEQLSTTGQVGLCGNFRGYIQYRKTFQNENRSDARLIHKSFEDGIEN